MSSERSSSEPAIRKALGLFHEAAERVPAYKDFLKKSHINHTRIKTIADFQIIPPTDSKNYVEAYSIEKRYWDGKISGAKLIATSSGTTGNPKFWPRGSEQDLEAAEIHRLLYERYFDCQKHSTLLLVGFPMGIYISGMATVLPSWLTSQKIPNLTIVTIGNNKTEMLRAVKNLSKLYDQTILIGHPFFIKDVIETGISEGISWAQKNLGLMFCSEGFSEDWRDYLREKAHIPRGKIRIFNTYGSSEMLLMGYESPLSIAFRRAHEGRQSVRGIFQYNPMLRFIETLNSEFLFTASSGVPLIRYNLKDKGELLSFEEIASTIKVDSKSPWQKLPFLALDGRSDQTMIFYAANIYPENIKVGLSAGKFFSKLTGKFTIQKEYLKNMDERLEINIELRPDIKTNQMLARSIQKHILTTLENLNLEYNFLRKNLDKDIVPRIKLWPYGDAKYFKPGLKPRYIAKN